MYERCFMTTFPEVMFILKTIPGSILVEGVSAWCSLGKMICFHQKKWVEGNTKSRGEICI